MTDTTNSQTDKAAAERVFQGVLRQAGDIDDFEQRLMRDAWDAALAYCARHTAIHETEASRDVLAERHRQISAEGWTPKHDDKATDGALSLAAATYALHGLLPTRGSLPLTWPWAPEGWKPSAPRHNLVKVGALILAEIERFDRAAAGEVRA
nr:hypothetical protein [uncultured Cupriavidus sp.]